MSLKRRSRKSKQKPKQKSRRSVEVVEEYKGPSKIYYYFYNLDGSKLSLKGGFYLLKSSESFRSQCTKILNNVPFKAYLFKITALNRTRDFNRVDKYFKFTVKDAPMLYNRIQDPTRFINYINDPKYYVINHDNDVIGSKYWTTFISPSGNKLLVPKPIEGSNKNTYVHFSNFMKLGPVKQIDEFWRIFAEMVIEQFESSEKSGEDCKVYLNTQGYDVPWLHVRFDKVPDKIIWS